MAKQQGVLLSDTVYGEVTRAISQLDFDDLGKYRVVWTSETHDHQTTIYEIVGTRTKIGETTLLIEGGRGGRYEIIPKPNNPAWIQYLHPSQPSSNWDEELTHLAILSPEFEYVNEDGLTRFLSKVKDIISFE